MGNIISDFVKGKKKFEYPGGIQKGIALHREIDRFTDSHEATKEAKEIFRPQYRLYSGPFVDILYDHFLAIDENEFPGNSLYDFSQQVYSSLTAYRQWFPERFSFMFLYMKKDNWLFNYRIPLEIKKSFAGLAHRAAYLEESDIAFKLFQDHYQLLQQCYRHFWPEVKSFVQLQFELLTGKV